MLVIWMLLSAAFAVANEQAQKRISAHEQLLQGQGGKPVGNQLFEVNRFFNQLAFTSDLALWQQEDYWATPDEFLTQGAGDCEDFSVAKYFSLLRLGVPPERLRLVYVVSKTLQQHHMVVAYYETPGAVPLLLDNIKGEILPANQRPDLVPVFSFNGEQLWVSKQGTTTVSDANRLAKWKSLKDRYQPD